MSASAAAVVYLVARDALAAVLVIAGSAKLADLNGFEQTLAGLFDLSLIQSRLLALLVPLFEIALGIAITMAMSRAVDAAALAIFVVFAASSAWALWRRPSLACRCFGSLSNSQFTTSGLIRGSLLVATAALALMIGPGAVESPDRSGPPTMLVVAAFGVLGIAAWQAARTIDRVREALNT